VVDQLDYDAWRANVGSTTNVAADGNGNGVVDAADFTIWRDRLTTGGGAAVAANTTTPTALAPATTGAVLPVSALALDAAFALSNVELKASATLDNIRVQSKPLVTSPPSSLNVLTVAKLRGRLDESSRTAGSQIASADEILKRVRNDVAIDSEHFIALREKSSRALRLYRWSRLTL
jgi:hypothetical protein